MASGFEHLVDEGVITEVLGRLKSGKEADVYVVRYGGKIVAAKVYKDRAQRSFKNNSGYTEGRSVRNTRSARAMSRKTSFGQAASESAWKAAEADALYKLHAAEVRVPTPVMFLEGVLFMELVVDADGEAAPRLIDTDLTVAEANAAYHDMVKQLVRILSCDLIHGDLSPYNVLWAAAGPTIIDFPQIISASHNSRSEAYFLRDARNILGHLASIDRSLHARSGDPAEIWRAYVRRELSPDFVPQGRPQFVAHRPRQADPHAQPHGPQHGHPRAPAHHDQRPPHPGRDARQGGRPPQPPQRGPGAGGPRPAPHQHHGPPNAQRRPGPRVPEVIVHVRGSTSPAPAAQPSPPREERPGAPEQERARPRRRRRRR